MNVSISLSEFEVRSIIREGVLDELRKHGGTLENVRICFCKPGHATEDLDSLKISVRGQAEIP